MRSAHPATDAARQRLQRAALVRRAALSLALALLLLLAGLRAAHAQDTLPPAVLQALQAAQVPADGLAAMALPLHRHGLPWRHRAEVAMQPASTMKLVTSIVALDRLGPNARGHTTLLSDAPLDGEVLRGDLVLQGGADPDLGLAQFWALLAELRAAGVREISGRLVVDRQAWRPARPDLGVPPFDEAPEFPYNVIPDALQLMGALLPLELRATEQGVAVRSVPPLDGLQIESRMTLNDRPCAQWSRDWQSAQASRAEDGQVRLVLNGAFPRGCIRRAELQLMDRQWLTERVFATLWRQLGGSWSGASVEAAAPAGARVLARREARPWGEVLRQLNKASDNAHARMLFNALGPLATAVPAAFTAASPSAGSASGAPTSTADPAGRAATATLAAQAVAQWFAAHGIAPDGLVMDNGSGLSRSARISALQMVRLLQVAHAGPMAPELLMSLPVAGTDGTLRNRLKDSPATGWARLKTGTLWNVSALAGYVNDDTGRTWAVAVMVNHPNAARARPVLDAFVDWVARGGTLLPLWAPGEGGPPGS